MSSPDSPFWMELALFEAEKGRGRVEPNPMVGAVVLQGNEVVGIGHHGRFGGPHAEVVALQAAGPRARGATLYVTLEPCCHQGKTPPCTGAILDAGITRVVAAMADPFPSVAGGGLALLRQAGVEVAVGLCGEDAIALNAPYLKRVLTGTPYVIAKWAMTLDGKTATASGDSQWISSPSSRAHVHELRGRMDAIIAGIGTVLADDPQLTARPPGPRTPVRVVLDSQARLPAVSDLARTAREVPVLVAVARDAPEERVSSLRALGCDVLRTPNAGRIAIEPLLKELGQRGMTNVLVEGGGTVLGAFLDAGQVDEVEVYVAPVLEGGDHSRSPARGRGVALMSAARRLEQVTHDVIETDVRVRGLLPQAWRTLLAGLRTEPDAALTAPAPPH